MKIKILENEYWWAGTINCGTDMPYHAGSDCEFDINAGGELLCDQFAPLMVSSLGRYIWSEEEFKGVVKNGEIILSGRADFELCEGYESLKGAYLAASAKHFAPTGGMPDEKFWKVPQYNTWVELGHNQNAEGIIKYAESIIENGLPAGVMMIDGGWQEDYGIFEFNLRKVPDPGAMIEKLHSLGFPVMLWVSPIVASAGARYKELRDKGYLVKNKNGEPVIRQWWSGYSTVLDFSNPEAVSWFKGELEKLMKNYGVDGFKFDAGDVYFYDDNDVTLNPTTARNQTLLFNKIGMEYKLNEFRSAWKCGGQGIVARLHDKTHTWDRTGLGALIPHTLVQGLSGYAYCCPDMVGGGMPDSFEKGTSVDEELFVRWAQANALMGMIQMSVSPWKVLSEKNTELVKNALSLHAEYGEHIYSLAKYASETGEPVVRAMAYEFPNENYERTNDMFMLGSDILVAPVVIKGDREKTVRLPEGKWEYIDGSIYEGGREITVPAPLEVLPVFKKYKKAE